MYLVRKKLKTKLSIAHALNSSYTKGCQKIHGHNYYLEVFIGTDELNHDGMVIDFKRLKEIVNKCIINEFDHSMVLSKTYKNISAFKIITPGLVITDYNPTAENMSRDFYERLYPVILKEIPSLLILKVRLHETDTGYCEYSEHGYPMLWRKRKI